MPSKEVFDDLIRERYRVDLCPYTSFDSLASEKDLEQLFYVLMEFKDRNGFHPVITANAVMANPDFEKIRQNRFSEYIYKRFTDTLKKYPDHSGSFNLWKQGKEENLFYPQFHGREHLNVRAWMDALDNKKSKYRSVFDREIFWLGAGEEDKTDVSIRAAFDAQSAVDIEDHKKIIEEGLDLFEEIFGYRSESFIAPNFVFSGGLNSILYDGGVKYIQGMKYQKLPKLERNKNELVRHFQGERNHSGQFYLVRNCVFEPSQFPESYDNVEECLKGIKNAFLWRKPAIISAHRLNFIGHIVPENRERNLKLFRELLKSILVQWPEVEFMTSAQLGDLIAESRN